MLETPANKKQTLAAVPSIEKFNRQNSKSAAVCKCLADEIALSTILQLPPTLS